MFNLRVTMSPGLWMKWCHSPQRIAGHLGALEPNKFCPFKLSGYYYFAIRIQQAPFLSCPV